MKKMMILGSMFLTVTATTAFGGELSNKAANIKELAQTNDYWIKIFSPTGIFDN